MSPGRYSGVQISSKALQVTLEERRLYQFEFIDDSAEALGGPPMPRADASLHPEGAVHHRVQAPRRY